MKKRSKSVNSKFEQGFQTSLTFKRNKRYIDLDKMNNAEKQYSIKRRKPGKTEDDHIMTKIHSSFMNSTAQLTQRRQKNINKYKSRVSCSQSRISVSPEQSSEVDKNQKVRSFSMQKMTSRQYIHKLKNKPVPDERLFSNYSEIKPDLVHTPDFKKRKGKQLDNRLKHVNDIYHETQKLYEDYYYKKTTNQTKVNYRAERKLKSERVFFVDKRPENKPSTILQPEDVDNGLKIASNFKKRNISDSKIDGFYSNTGRQLPCQFDMRNMTELTNYWKGENDQIERPKLDYGTRKMKDDLIEGRKEKIKNSKKADVKRKDICDQRFFKYFKKN